MYMYMYCHVFRCPVIGLYLTIRVSLQFYSSFIWLCMYLFNCNSIYVSYVQLICLHCIYVHVCGAVDSGSARYNADRKAKTVQARIEANLTSQSVSSSGGGLSIFSREPNRKNSVFVGNMNWV